MNIMFIGTLESTFGKKKVYDYDPKRSTAARGTDVPELKQRIKDVRKGYANINKMHPIDISRLKHKQNLNAINVRGIRLSYKTQYQSQVDKLKEPIADRLRSYKFNKEKNKEFAEVDNWLENRKKRNQATESIVDPLKSTNSAPKVTSSNTTKTPTPLLQYKPKLVKLGLGAVGLLGASAIGYGIYRKIRSDKGKKRK